MEQNKEPHQSKPQQNKIYTYQDLVKFSGMEIYSGFGQMRVSVKPSAPQYSFGTQNRDSGPKKYTSKEMAQIDCFGIKFLTQGKQTSQGPNYNVHDKFSYQQKPKWKFGTTARNTLDTKAKYEHYYRPDVDFDPDDADKSRRLNLPNTRIGGQQRFPPDVKKYKMTPGPQYNPNLRPEIPIHPHYSLYSRRPVKGFDPLIQFNCTPPIVGPGSYHPQNSSFTSDKVYKPVWSVPKGPKIIQQRNKWSLNQTYDTSTAIGNQPNSQKPSRPQYSCGKSKRETPAGIFKQHMQFKQQPIRIIQPKW